MEVVVVYHVWGEELRKAYATLKAEFPRVSFRERSVGCGFIKETLPLLFNVRNLYRFLKYRHLRIGRDGFKRIIDATIKDSHAGYVMFMTDDEVVYRPQYIASEIFGLIQGDPANNSYRCYVGQNLDNVPDFLVERNGYLEWNYYDKRGYSHWAYPFAVDGTIYDRVNLLRIISPVLYHMPTTLESHVVSNVRARRQLANGYSPIISTMVGVCLNKVQKLVGNQSGSFNVDVLNGLYLEGFRIKEAVGSEVSSYAIIPKFVLVEKAGEVLRVVVADGLTISKPEYNPYP